MKLSKFNLFLEFNKEKDQFILFNTLNGNSFLINSDVVDKMKNNQIESLPNELRNELTKKKIILYDYIDENKYFDYYHNKTKYGKNNLSFTILLTWACNLKCVYCYEGAGEKKSYSMSTETADLVIEFIKNEILKKSSKVVSILLFGGEPLVNYSTGEYILEKVNEYCKEKGIILTTSIVTNGVLLDEKIIESLIEYNCKYVQVTLDGPKEIHNKRRMKKDGSGTFDDIIESLELLLQYKDRLHTVIRVNVDKSNIEYMDDLLALLEEKGLDQLNIDFGVVHGGTEACVSYEDNCYREEELGEMLSSLWDRASKTGFDITRRPLRKWAYCGLNCDNSFTIEPKGELYKCWEHVGEQAHKIGDIGKNGQPSEMTYRYFEWMTRNPLNVEMCSNCVYLPACGGGCGAISYNNDGVYESAGCFKIKGVIEDQVRNYFTEKLNKRV
ncbi:Cys-every-fifth radical SAM/SPASM peptide maturase CefB [Clostridiaceae bacterium M8S5]|nr:Cys-every-fifth radical SAM/SPASM peptide maturase CefB [Clostridiaceae bacterium M8S5]